MLQRLLVDLVLAEELKELDAKLLHLLELSAKKFLIMLNLLLASLERLLFSKIYHEFV